MNDLEIDMHIDKEPLRLSLTDDRVINVTGEGGSGKTYYCRQFRDNPDYLVIDYDVIILGECEEGSIEDEVREKLIQKYGVEIFKPSSREDMTVKFSIIYEEILEMLLPLDKIVVFDGTQLRFIDDIDKIVGELIVLRPSIDTCVERSVKRKRENNPTMTEDEIKKYEMKRRRVLCDLNPLLNDLIIKAFKKAEEVKGKNLS